MEIASFHTDLTDAQCRLLAPLLPAPKGMGCPPTPVRRLLDAVCYLVKSCCQWRLLPKTFPPWQTVYHRFRQWCQDGTWKLINDALHSVVRVEEVHCVEPSAEILDRQKVRSEPHGGEVGCDAIKRTKGRKWFLLVDSLGLLLGVLSLPADTAELTTDFNRMPGPRSRQQEGGVPAAAGSAEGAGVAVAGGAAQAAGLSAVEGR